jgi:hypothetical protein
MDQAGERAAGASTGLRLASSTVHLYARRIAYKGYIPNVAGRRSVTADKALRFARALGTTADFWMNLQKTYDLRTAEIELGSSLKSIKPLPRAKNA